MGALFLWAAPKQLLASNQGERTGATIVGSVVLTNKATGKEVNLDGTPKGPYRHPNHIAKVELATPQSNATANQGAMQAVEEIIVDARRQDIQRTRPQHTDVRTNILSVKPAKLNISEFDGTDADSWI